MVLLSLIVLWFGFVWFCFFYVYFIIKENYPSIENDLYWEKQFRFIKLSLIKYNPFENTNRKN
jgi:hypothetical protein